MTDDELSPSADAPADTSGPEADPTIDLPASHGSQPRSGAESAAAAAGSDDGGTTPPPAGRAGELPPDGDATTPPPGGGSGPGSQLPAFSPRFPWPDRGGDQSAPADPLIGSELGGVRIVREDDPTPISSLNKTLRRDGAVIASKCLQKYRTRRYSSATELDGDVVRYLAGEPITAVPPTFWDAIVRLARRHKAAAAAVTAIAVSLVVAGKPAETEAAAVTSEGSTSLLDGAWRKVVPAGQPDIKLVNADRFTWLIAEEGKIVRSATGRCSLEGDRYTESIETVGVAGEDARMAKSTGRFRVRLIGNRWIHEGTIVTDAGDQSIQEVWERIPSGSATRSPSGRNAP
jgi:hypothetical protein